MRRTRKQIRFLRVFILSLFLCGSKYPFVLAKDLGSFGATFPIREKDLLEFIQEKLSTLKERGEIEKHQLILQQQAASRALNPRPVQGIVKATKNRVYSYDPSTVLSADLKDHQGNILMRRGTSFNPLDKVSLSKPLVFFDGDDPHQKAWVLKHFRDGHDPDELAQEAKLILVKGKPVTLSEEWQVPVFFDQEGKITQKLQITAVPAVVSQKGRLLEIKEFVVEDGE